MHQSQAYKLEFDLRTSEISACETAKKPLNFVCESFNEFVVSDSQFSADMVLVERLAETQIPYSWWKFDSLEK